LLGEDPELCSIEKMRHTLKVLCYSVGQGLIADPLRLDDLFAAEQKAPDFAALHPGYELSGARSTSHANLRALCVETSVSALVAAVPH